VAIRTVGFDHVHLHADDVERAVAFYRAAFGAEEAFRVGERLVFVRLGGSDVIALDSRRELDRAPSHFGLRLAEGEELGTAVAAFVNAGGAVVERDEHEPGVDCAYVADPDGNMIEL
jgi:catechol 2,3-dioxygenase-like lactoylglutathione lyase family enzyme